MNNLIAIMLITLSVFCAIPQAEANEKLLYGFATVGLEYEFNEADAYYYTERTGGYTTHTDDLPTDRFLLQLGFETKSGFSFGYQHLSGATGGCPLDCKGAEYYRDSLFINYKFGGAP